MDEKALLKDMLLEQVFSWTKQGFRVQISSYHVFTSKGELIILPHVFEKMRMVIYPLVFEGMEQGAYIEGE